MVVVVVPDVPVMAVPEVSVELMVPVMLVSVDIVPVVPVAEVSVVDIVELVVDITVSVDAAVSVVLTLLSCLQA